MGLNGLIGNIVAKRMAKKLQHQQLKKRMFQSY